jgi:poly-gamma-glutamate synthesis protein (capsule biosynthesis protein)
VTAVTVGLLGDVMLGRGVADALDPARPEAVWAPDLRALVAAECDLVVCNLECCLSERGRRTRRIRGKPFFFRGPPAAVGSLRGLGVRAVGLANNHALDYEEEALADTLELLAGAQVAIAGAGRDEAHARRTAMVDAASARLALVAVSDHPSEFAAGPGKPGIAWANLPAGLPDWLEAQLAQAREAANLVVAFPHWGPNMSPSPARWQRDRAGDLLAAGADLVAGHSAHVFQGVARGDGGQPILHDLGDALDDYAIDASLRNDLGLLALWRPGGDPDVELVGLRLRYALTEIAAGEDAEWISRRLEGACGKLGTRVERTAEARFAVR